MDRTILNRKLKYFRSKQPPHSKNLSPGKNPNWWTPVWRGLIADSNSKHRKAMGTSVWMFLYLLTYAKDNFILLGNRSFGRELYPAVGMFSAVIVFTNAKEWHTSSSIFLINV